LYVGVALCEGGFAEQIQALLLGHKKKKAAAKAGGCDSDGGSGNEMSGMSDSEMSDGDESAEEAGDDGADVTAVCLDLKGEHVQQTLLCIVLIPGMLVSCWWRVGGVVVSKSHVAEEATGSTAGFWP
jgi:hypothetical protein